MGCILAVDQIAAKSPTPLMNCHTGKQRVMTAPTPPASGTAFGPLTFGQRRSKHKSSWRDRIAIPSLPVFFLAARVWELV